MYELKWQWTPYTCKWHHSANGPVSPRMLAEPRTSPSSPTGQPWRSPRPNWCFVHSLTSFLLSVWNTKHFILVSDPMKGKSHKTKSIQSLGWMLRWPGLYAQQSDLAEATEGLDMSHGSQSQEEIQQDCLWIPADWALSCLLKDI